MPVKSCSAIHRDLSVKIGRRGAERLLAGHVWVYRSDILSADGIPPGALVNVFDERRKFLGTALYSSSSQIALRLFSREPVRDFPALLRDRIRAAIAYREQVVQNTGAYRVVFSEGDFLPGLIVDRYNDLLSIQILTQGMDSEAARQTVIPELNEQLKPGAIAERVDPRVRELEQLPARPSALIQGEKSSTVITMNGREIEWIEANAFDLLRDYAAAGRQYDCIVLDPPAFAKSKRNLETAFRGYKELNLRALKMLRPGGLLVTCSCSYHVSPAEFIEVVASAARDVHRNIRLLENRTQAKDHPILLHLPETAYLKCVVATVSY